MKPSQAVFLDRDGVLNELVYYGEHGILDSPASPEQFRLFPWVGEALRRLHGAGLKIIIVSNQPGIAKGNFTRKTFERIRGKMTIQLQREKVAADGEYYCFHHPDARFKPLRADCECRKPRPGLLLQAAREMDIDLGSSWMIGDGLTDIKAGKAAGCGTILLGRMKCELCHLMDEERIRPDFVADNLLEAVQIIGRQLI